MLQQFLGNSGNICLVLSEINVWMHIPIVKYYVNKKRLLKMLMGIINVLLTGKPGILCNDLKKILHVFC